MTYYGCRCTHVIWHISDAAVVLLADLDNVEHLYRCSITLSHHCQLLC